MDNVKRKEAAYDKFKKLRPSVVSILPMDIVKSAKISPEQSLPLIFHPSIANVDVVEWVKANREYIESKLLDHGGVLFRGFDGMDSATQFNNFVSTLSDRLMGYLDHHTPRTRISENIYTSTEYPADHHIPFHSENSKNHIWPLKLWFFCMQVASEGGETPIADNRKVFSLLNPKLRDRFIEKGVMYVRNFGEGVGLSWQSAFQTTSREEVERYFREAKVDFEWKTGDRLRVKHVCQSVAAHPQSSEMVWFNQAHLFHVTSVDAEAQESLLSMFDEEDLPSNAYYGDGSTIEGHVLDEIRKAYKQAEVVFQWQSGDILMLDNMLVSHGRRPFTGTRKVLVAMAEPWSARQLNSMEAI